MLIPELRSKLQKLNWSYRTNRDRPKWVKVWSVEAVAPQVGETGIQPVIQVLCAPSMASLHEAADELLRLVRKAGTPRTDEGWYKREIAPQERSEGG